VVDDKPDLADGIRESLKDEFALVDVALSGAEAVERVSNSSGFYDVIVMDQNLGSDLDGIDYMQDIHHVVPDTVVIILTAYGEKEKAMRAMREGAYRYLFKPATDEELVATIASGYELVCLRRSNRSLGETTSDLRAGLVRTCTVAVLAGFLLLALSIIPSGDRFTMLVGAVAILIVLFAGWQGIARAELRWLKRLHLSVKTKGGR